MGCLVKLGALIIIATTNMLAEGMLVKYKGNVYIYCLRCRRASRR